MADNLLTTVLLATRAMVMICPAMNVNMYNNLAVQENMEKLRRRGYVVVEPDEGGLACGWEGKGRLPEVGRIMEEIERLLSPKDLSGERVLVTAGATREFIDSIRFISNPSSGKMGYALARAGWMRGADVLLISAKTDVEPPCGVSLINVVTVSEMHEAVMSNLDWSSVVIKAAAVGDYKPVETFQGKLKKNSKEIHLKLERTQDILLDVGKNKNGRIVVGFAAEGENVVENALGKLRKKNADLIVANDIHRPGAGFGQDTNIVCFVDRWGKVEELPIMTKAEIADKIFDKILEFRKENPIQAGR
jgi:phosphopantothenoylcysteine decarboxylase/phosphopantothenate--cysteine ligase